MNQTTPSPAPSPRPRARTEVELAAMQLEALEAWNRARQMAEQAAAARTASREVRMDVTRRLEVWGGGKHAIVQRTEMHLDASVHLLARRVHSRAVIVHRSAWFTSKISDELAARGVEVVGALDNGAEGVGVVVVEQPDLLIVEDTLPMVPGEEVVRESRRFAPSTLVVAQVAHTDRVARLLDAGAVAAYTRRVPPADVAQEALTLLEPSATGRADLDALAT
jgi:CheY-like chemotaxis protein